MSFLRCPLHPAEICEVSRVWSLSLGPIGRHVEICYKFIKVELVQLHFVQIIKSKLFAQRYFDE